MMTSDNITKASLSTLGLPLVSVIVIGKNEGVRLTRCLESIAQVNWGDLAHEVIYVDSRSSDDSLSNATQLGAATYLLEDPSPCAAKARNLGVKHAKGEFILFLDGDTILHPEFVIKALNVLHRKSETCAVWGHRREIDPEQSLFTKVMDLDWVYPVGETLYFGGDVLARRDALGQVNGFDPTLKAGEEPELCARLRSVGWKIEHIDEPMTMHDLGIRHWRPYWLRAYRSGVAYAEISERMRQRGDALWQKAARRDFIHGLIYSLTPLWLVIILLASYPVNLILLATAMTGVLLIVIKTARGCKWKAPGNSKLIFQYALHVHLQKIPAFWGQLHWRMNRHSHSEQKLIDYKTNADRSVGVEHQQTNHQQIVKRLLLIVTIPIAKVWNRIVIDGWQRIWSLARLSARTMHAIDSSNVVYGPVEVHGTGNIRLGRNALIYPDCYLETQGQGEITLGDDVVLSRGVHIVAHTQVRIEHGVIIGEYSSIRDANHIKDPSNIRNSGHHAAPIHIEENVWLARGTTILMGVHIGRNAIIAAGSVVNRNIDPDTMVGGIPARLLESSRDQTAPEIRNI